MALVLQDRVREISTTTGTGTVTLSGAYPGGYRTFASCVPNGSTVYYCIHNTADGYQTEWEVGYGTYSSNTLTRTSVLSSSNANAAVSFSAGDKEVFITYPAEKAIYEEVDGQTLINGGPITVVGSNVTSLPTLPAELGKFVGNIDLFAQIYNLNQNSGSNASADFVAYNSDTDANGTTFFVDMGINSPNYSSVDYPIFTPHSGYVFSYGDANTHPSTLFLGSGDNDVRIFAGGLNTNNTVATFNTDLSTDLAGALDVGSTLNVTGVTTLSALAYTSGNIAAAANNTVLVTKAYVDDATSNGFHVHTPVLVATTGNLTASYNNGSSGVGATLTNSGAQAALSIDGVAMNVADRVLVWQQTTGTQNGVYVVTTVGSGSTNWVLTRASDADTSSEGDPNSLGGGDYFFVESGSTLGYHSYICTNTDAIVFGTTAITFSEFSSIPAYTGGTNINVDGQVISITGTVGPTNGGTGVNTVTTGDLLYGSASNTWSKLAKGSAYKSLVMNAGGTNVEWNAVALGASGAVSGVLPETYGGTNNSTYTLGDTLYSSAANTLAKLAGNTTTTKKYMQQQGNGSVSAAPSWQQIAAADISGLAASATTDTTNASNISSGTLANARTTASSSNGASTIVARDASGNFAANTITANLTGNASGTAGSLATAQNISISGGVTAANVSFNGTAAVGLSVTAMNASVINAGTIGNAYTTAASSNGASTIVARDASGNFSANTITATQVNTSGAGITSLNASVINSGTIGNAYTTGSASNGASTLVLRDASGNFAANTITATLTGTASNATVLQTARTIGIGTGATGTATSFDGSAAITIPITDVNASYLGSGTVPVARVSGSYTGITGVGTLTAGTWNASAISDTYLSTISTAGKVSNSATTASSSNGASTIVARDASGNFSANTVTAALSGNASTATTLQTARTIAIGTGATGTATSFNGSADITIPITDVNASYIGTGTLANARTTASSSNGASTIIARDASGNFTANNITANGDVTSSSDESLKTNWANVIYDFVEKLAEVKSGVYIRVDTGAEQAGVSAQSLASVLPQATGIDENGKMTVAYGQAALVAAVELAKQVVELKKEIELLKAK